MSYVLKDHTGHIVTIGAIAMGKTLTFDIKGKTPYFFYIPRGIYYLSIKGAAVAYLTSSGKSRHLHPFGQPTTLFYYVPENVKNWDFMVCIGSGGGNGRVGETAKVTVITPGGKQAAVLETTKQPTQRVTLEGQTGFWKIEVSQADQGILDDVFLTFDKDLPQWVSVDPEQPLIISSAK